MNIVLSVKQTFTDCCQAFPLCINMTCITLHMQVSPYDFLRRFAELKFGRGHTKNKTKKTTVYIELGISEQK